MYIFEWCTLLKCSPKCPCTCILTAIINISNKIGSILTNCMSNECTCIHTHSNLAKSGIWSIDCEIWDMRYWGVKNMGYGILGGKKYGIWDMGTPVSPPPPPPHLYTENKKRQWTRWCDDETMESTHTNPILTVTLLTKTAWTRYDHTFLLVPMWTYLVGYVMMS